MIKTELYFGRSIGVDERITDEQWYLFEQGVIGELFDGFTVLHGFGHWKGKIEKCMVVVILHDSPLNGPDYRIEQIRGTYCGRFDQESVLRVDSEVKVSW